MPCRILVAQAFFQFCAEHSLLCENFPSFLVDESRFCEQELILDHSEENNCEYSICEFVIFEKNKVDDDYSKRDNGQLKGEYDTSNRHILFVSGRVNVGCFTTDGMSFSSSSMLSVVGVSFVLPTSPPPPSLLPNCSYLDSPISPIPD